MARVSAGLMCGSTGATLALKRIARRYGITQQTLIERLLLAEDERVLNGIAVDSAEWKKYFGIGESVAKTSPGATPHENCQSDKLIVIEERCRRGFGCDSVIVDAEIDQNLEGGSHFCRLKHQKLVA